jgi:hypothetical protein
MLARAAIGPTNGEMLLPDGDGNVFGFQPWHGCGKDKKLGGLMQLDGNGLWLLEAGRHGVLLPRQYMELCVVCCSRLLGVLSSE